MARIARAQALKMVGSAAPSLSAALKQALAANTNIEPKPANVEKERVAKLCASVEGTVFNFARRYAQSPEHLADLLQEGRLGVLKAVQKWRKDGGANFHSYATMWIRAYVFRHLKLHNSLVSRDWNGKNLKHDVPRDRSMNVSAHADDKDGETFLDLLEDPNGVSAEDVLDGKSRDKLVFAKLENLRARLGPVGWDVVTERLMKGIYGIDEGVTLSEIGEKHSISRERVRQIELRVKKLLKRYLAEFDYEGAYNDNVQEAGLR